MALDPNSNIVLQAGQILVYPSDLSHVQYVYDIETGALFDASGDTVEDEDLKDQFQALAGMLTA